MPITHRPPGAGGGQFAPGGGSQSQQETPAQKYLRASADAINKDRGKKVALKLTGSKKQVSAETRYLKALERDNHRKVALNARTVKKVRAAQTALAKKKAAAVLKAKHLAARNATARAKYLAHAPIVAKAGAYKPPVPGGK